MVAKNRGLVSNLMVGRGEMVARNMVAIKPVALDPVAIKPVAHQAQIKWKTRWHV